MANYSISINSKFRPFSYDEMMKPVSAMYEQHSKIEEGLAELETKANIWEGLANEQTDKRAYRQYKKYADDLRAAADDLAMNGLNARSRQSLYNMKARYEGEITPIEKAYERRERLAEEQRKYNMQYNNSLRFDNDFSTISLDALMDNPNISYRALNGENIAARTSAMISNLAKSITTEPQFKSILNGQYWQSMQQQGYTPSQIIAMAQNDPAAPAELRFLRDTIHNSLRDNPAYNEDWVNQWITQGAYSGIGGISYGTTANQDHLNPAQRQSMAINAAQFRWAQEDRQPYQVEVIGSDGKTKTVWVDPTKGGATFEVRDNKRVYTTGVGTENAGRIPEKDSSGNLTGRYYDPKTKKYYNADGSIAVNQSNRGSGDSGAGSRNTSRLANPVIVNVKGGFNKSKNTVYIGSRKYRNPSSVQLMSNGDSNLIQQFQKLGKSYDYIDLPRWAMEEADILIKNDSEQNYDYYIKADKEKASLLIIPRKNVRDTGDSSDTQSSNFNQDSW